MRHTNLQIDEAGAKSSDNPSSEPGGATPFLRPIERVAVNEQILSRLKAFIEHEHLKVGSKFPSERQISSELKVSRHSVREALSALGILGVLKRRQGQGTYLASTLPKPLHRPGQILGLQESSEIVELWEGRVALEPYVASLAAVRASEEDLRIIGKQIESMRNNLKDPGEFARHDLQFHISVAEASGNTTLGKISSVLLGRFFHRSSHLRILEYARGVSRKDGELPAFVADHESILNALRHRNPTLARSRMIHHLRAVGEFDVRLLRARAARSDGKDKKHGFVAKKRQGSAEDMILVHS